MCGRYNIVTNATALVDAFKIIYNNFDFSSEIFNAAPTPTGAKPEKFHKYPIVRSKNGEFEGCALVWPMIPKWANGQISKYSTANAMAETMAEKNSFKHAWNKQQRCLIPATGFYEWRVIEGKKNKQPYNIKIKAQELFAMAGLWEESGGVESFTIITTDANELMAEIHNTRKRMPVIVPPEQYSLWLNGPQSDAETCIKKYPSNDMRAYKISTAVNNPSLDDPKIILPIDPDESK